MARIALSGGAYQARSVIASAQRSLNLYAEPLPQSTGEPSLFAHYPTPGLVRLGTLPQNRVRGIRQVTTGEIYAVAGNTVYLVDPATWSGEPLGSITAGRYTPVSMADNGLTLVIVDGSPAGWTIDLKTHAFAQISSDVFYGADHVSFLDTFFIFNKPGTPQFYWSLSESADFDTEGLDFADKEINSDMLVTLSVVKREIWLLGSTTTEIWSDVGQPGGIADSQFQAVPGVFVDHGCGAKYSVAGYDNTLYWLAYNRAGQGIVMAGENYQTRRVSTYAIEAHFAERMPRLDDAIGFCYSLGGHAFYVLTFPEADETWCYDITTGQWHEWKWLDTNGAEHRHRANCAAFINGMVVVGDWENGNLYHVDPTIYQDDGRPIKRQRSFPHTLNQSDRVFYRQLVADMESGNPQAPGTQNQVTTWLETCTFTAANGTPLDAYSVPGEATWTRMPGWNGATINNGQLTLNAGTASFYRSPLQETDDYATFFRVIPSSYVHATKSSMWAMARNSGADVTSGYKVQVSGDGSQYYLYLQVGFSGAAKGVALGAISGGYFLVELVTISSTIAAACQRSQDGMWIQPDGSWSSAYRAALVMTDSTYSGAGYTLIGGIN